MSDCTRLAVRIEGVVQGVGFRPFVHSLAARHGLAGHVGNDSSGVFVEVEGPASAVALFLKALETDAPPLAQVERVRVEPISPTGGIGFAILASRAQTAATALVSADSATCADCLVELWDPADRRYRYPFINCTSCGPRFTIVRGVPYDRPLTTMAGFGMCSECQCEYDDPGDRRFHAQPVCCPECGPRLRLEAPDGEWFADDALSGAAERLRRGQVLAVKGLGGYHLAVDAADETAARALRSRKHREDRPFALMVPDVETARRLCHLDEAGRVMLEDRTRPIVLLPRRTGAAVAQQVAPGNTRLGLMLPYTPLHHLLLADFGAPIVLTSGNVSDEPIVYRDEDLSRLDGIADAYLTHDRPIHTRTDDSVVRPFRGRPQLQRRSRGFVPSPLRVPEEFPRPVLACGAELKNTFCLGRGRHAFVSHHIGDLENFETLQAFRHGIDHFQRLFDIRPELVAHDLHPEYLSTKHALALAAEGLETVGVQHHHAHIASCLADNLERGPVIGVALDGLGYGLDGTVWGGELLLADLAGFRRVGHLAPVPMPGGSTAIRQPWRMAAAYLDAVGLGDEAADLDVVRRHHADWADVVAVARAGVGSPPTSSAGRLFDAVAAVLGVRDAITYEGQAAIELEQCADPEERGSYTARIDDGDPLVLQGGDLLRACVADLRAGRDRATVAARFHNGVADLVVRACQRLRGPLQVDTVALSGGVFQNIWLLDRTVRGLEAVGMRVLVHSRVPTNDGGISLGQAVVAAAAATFNSCVT